MHDWRGTRKMIRVLPNVHQNDYQYFTVCNILHSTRHGADCCHVSLRQNVGNWSGARHVGLRETCGERRTVGNASGFSRSTRPRAFVSVGCIPLVTFSSAHGRQKEKKTLLWLWLYRDLGWSIASVGNTVEEKSLCVSWLSCIGILVPFGFILKNLIATFTK